MKKPLKVLVPLALALAVAAVAGHVGSAKSASSAPAAARCVKYAGVESSGNKNSMDPAQQPSSQNSLNMNASYDRLTTENDNWKVLPDLATSWKPNANGTVWTFQLRKGVKFWDGKPLTSADVVYTFRRVIDPKTGSEGASQMSFLTKAGIQPAGKYAVKFITAKPVAELPLLITNKNTFIVENGATTDTLRTKGAGTGPFIPVNFQPIQQVHTFKRNPNYWRKGLPKAPCLQLYVIQEANSMLAALQTGQVDFSQQVDYSVVPALQNDKRVKLMATGASTSMTMPMWTDTAPFDNVNVRQALKKVIDREQMVKTALLGYGVVGDDNPVPPTSPDAWRHKVPGPDIPGAVKLLAAAGYNSAHPLKVDIYTADMIPGIVNMVQLYKQQAAKAGIDVNVITGPPSEYWDNVWLKHPFEVSAWSARPAGLALSIAYLQNAPYPESHWKVPAYDALIQRANTTVNPAARRKLYQQAEQMLTEQGGEIIPMFQRVVAAQRSNCSGYHPSIQFVQFDLVHLQCK
jgi:peptide/nickel transport system substrate-binding protein